jgi:hypothetical protein
LGRVDRRGHGFDDDKAPAHVNDIADLNAGGSLEPFTVQEGTVRAPHVGQPVNPMLFSDFSVLTGNQDVLQAYVIATRTAQGNNGLLESHREGVSAEDLYP